MYSDESISKIINQLQLIPLPLEGGLFRQTYQSDELLPNHSLPERYPTPHSFSTAIYYLLTASPWRISAMHKLKSDEIYHFYLGDPVELLILYPDGKGTIVTLGPDILNGQTVQQVVPRDCWQGSHLIPGGQFALLGTTVAPGYEQSDFIAADTDDLCRNYPQFASSIRKRCPSAS